MAESGFGGWYLYQANPKDKVVFSIVSRYFFSGSLLRNIERLSNADHPLICRFQKELYVPDHRPYAIGSYAFCKEGTNSKAGHKTRL